MSRHPPPSRHRARARSSILRSRFLLPLAVSLLYGAAAFAEPVPGASHQAATRSSSEPATIQGHVLAVQGDDLILDLSASQGLAARGALELWRPLTLKHPVTGRIIRDRFRIGTLVLTQVRPSLSMAVAQGTLERTPEPGDIVLTPRLPPPASSAAAATTPPSTPATTAPAATASPLTDISALDTAPAPAPSAKPSSRSERDDDDVALSRLFDNLTGATPEQRIEAYVEFVKAHPNNRHTPALIDQGRQLHALMRQRERASVRAPKLQRHDPPELALAGRPLSLGVQLDSDHSSVLVHYRTPGDPTFHTASALRAGQRFFKLEVPGDAVREGGFEYFIETSNDSGEPIALAGTSEAPITVATRRDWDLSIPARPDATAQLSVDYADFNRLRGNDRAFCIEGDFGLRLRDVGLRALRSGFGVYRGVGGTIEDLDELGKSARAIGLTYGYLEAEYATSQSFAFIARTLLGLDDDGTNGGLQGHIRIGSDQATNVTLGGEILGNVGVRGITQLSLAPHSRVPIILRSEVGNQPAGVVTPDDQVRPFEDGAPLELTSTGKSDVGVRGIVQVGYRVLPELIIAARASYQGRNIKHSGPGFGAAVLYTW